MNIIFPFRSDTTAYKYITETSRKKEYHFVLWIVFAITASFLYNKNVINGDIKCFKTVWPCCTQRFQLSEWTLLCECHALRNLSGIGIKYLIFPFLLAIVCGRKKHHWTRPEVTVWNTFHCCYIRYAGILKQATMNRKRSGLFVTIWCEAAKGLKCWSIWLTSVTVPWRFCPIRTNIFLSTVQKAYRSFVLN